MTTALLCVDVQRDFCPGGALAVADGDEVVAALVAETSNVGLVVASRDWHPPDHCSFLGCGGTWPRHCVAGTRGAEILPEIDALADVIVSKATRPDDEAYSAFDAAGLAELLRARDVTTVVVGGLATDYCVRASALDALAAGFDVVVPRADVRAVDVERGDGDRALAELASAGATVIG